MRSANWPCRASKKCPPDKSTTALFEKGTHGIGKKLVEEAAESWMAARYESRDAIALELSQVLYYVANGILDAGITGQDFVAEKGLAPTCLYELNYGQSKLCVAAPVELNIESVAELRGKRIATSFPNLTARFFPERELLVELEGAVEIR